MSAARYGLPTSLTPDLLKEILRYEPRHWKAIKAKLVRKRPTLWKEMNLSEYLFYDKLHEHLGDPINRRDFDSVARRQDTKRRSFGLYRGIHQYYGHQLADNESFIEHMPKRATPREYINAVAHCENDDRLANIVWTLFDEGDIAENELAELCEKYPGILLHLKPVLDANDTDADTVVKRWEACISRIRGTLEAADSKTPEIRVAEQLTECAAELMNLATEAETHFGFSSSLVELLRNHESVLSERASLRPYVAFVEKPPFAGPVPDDFPDFLEKLDESLKTLAKVVKDIIVKSAAIPGADAEQRGKLGAEIGILSASQEKAYTDIEDLLRQLIDDDEVDAEVSEPELELSGGDEAEDERDDQLAGPGPRRAAKNGPEESTNKPSADAEQTERKKSLGNKSGGDVDGTVELVEGVREVVAESRSYDAEATGIEAVNTTDSSTEDPDKRSDSTKATPAPSHDGTAKQEELDQLAPSFRASEVLRAMLSTGRFARAYWLTRADHTLGDSNLYGALSEGSRIGPGGSCPGALLQFFMGLAEKDRWQDDERLLLSASVLGACLFVDPLPQDIYQLAPELPPESSPVGPLIQRVRDLCIHQNAKIRPEDLGEEPADTARSVKLDKLSSDAESFLQRVPFIRFQYAPAVSAIQFVYRAGSEWHRLHTIVGRNQSHRLNEAKNLVKALNPLEIVANLHGEDELSILRQPLHSRARDKLIRHLHDSLVLAREWIRLVSAGKYGDPSINRTQSEELLGEFKRLLPAARKALIPIKGRGAVDAFDIVLENLQVRIQGHTPDELTGISGDLRLLPGLVLEDDLEPPEDQLDDLKRAILEAEQSEPEPSEILRECLSRQEYRRAREIIIVHELGESAQAEYQRAVSRKRSALRTAIKSLAPEIEEAFLLGQLRDDAEANVEATQHTRNALERSQLLGLVRDAGEQLDRCADSDADELRAISLRIDEVEAKTKDMTSKRRARLHREFKTMIEQLPQTEQGQADRVYLRGAFDECMNSDDHVAAFDLLDRGRKATQGVEPVARASTGSSDNLALFLKRAGAYQNALSQRDWPAKAQECIRQGTKFSGIAFGQLDRARRQEASVALQKWCSIMRLRFPAARRGLTESMEQLLRFIGLPLQEGGIEIADTTQDGFAHVRATFTRAVTSSPLPAFGSACGYGYEIVVSQTRKEPEQFEEYIRGRKLAGRPILALLLLPHRAAYRVRWQRYFSRARLTVLPLDLVIFLHLCGERNRLPVLFELGLPFTWARPYITKGENVAVEMFVGRHDETTALMDPDGSCIVFGGRQLGKSALLRHVHREHHDPDRAIYVVYLDVDDLGTDSLGHDAMTAVFWRRVYDELARCAAIAELPQKVLARDSRLIDEVPNRIATSLSANSKMRIVLLLDETDDLLDCDSGQDFALVRRLRSLMASSGRRFKVVFAGLQSVQRYYNWKNHPFAQLGNELVVNPLPPAAAQELIIRPMRALGFAFENTGLVLRILSQTNYHPGLLQIFGYRLLDSLFDKSQRQKGGGPIRRISADDLLAVERDRSVMEDIRNRFDWTLDLDDRYKVLTYALVLTPDPIAPRRESEFMAIGAEWWPAVFETMDAQGLRAVLDEMVGLGVLLGEHDDAVRTYRLRSPNLLRLLGPQDAIDAELLRIIERDQVSRPNPRNFHPRIDQKPVMFGPLTIEQEGQFDGYRRPFQLTLVSGSEALGLGEVTRQFDWLLASTRDDKRVRSWRKIAVDGPLDADALIERLRKSLRPRRRTHRYAVGRLGDIEFEGALSQLFNHLVRDLGQVCTNDSRGHLILLLNPADTWRWLSDRNREQVLSQPRVTGLELRRWSDGAIANAFDRIEARTGSQHAGSEVFKLTSGFHWLVNQGLAHVPRRSVANAQTLVELWETLRSETLTDGAADAALRSTGIRGTDPTLDRCLWEVLRLRETLDGELMLTETSFDLAAEVLGASDRQWFEGHASRIQEWMQTMDLARPNRVREENSMIVAPLVEDLIKATGD